MSDCLFCKMRHGRSRPTRCMRTSSASPSMTSIPRRPPTSWSSPEAPIASAAEVTAESSGGGGPHL